MCIEDVENRGKAFIYAMKYEIRHLCEGGLSKEGRRLMFQFEWLLQRAVLGPVHALVEDANRVAEYCNADDRPFQLLHSAYVCHNQV